MGSLKVRNRHNLFHNGLFVGLLINLIVTQKVNIINNIPVVFQQELQSRHIFMIFIPVQRMGKTTIIIVSCKFSCSPGSIRSHCPPIYRIRCLTRFHFMSLLFMLPCITKAKISLYLWLVFDIFQLS